MKSSAVPTICSFALTAMCAAGFASWWSVRQFTTAVNHIQTPAPAPPPPVVPTATAETTAATPQADPAQKEFFEKLISRMENLQNQNRDLLDQLAETNRDLMKLEFRVDTHSESFRPLPVRDDRPFTTATETPDVLPPRATPVILPMDE